MNNRSGAGLPPPLPPHLQEASRQRAQSPPLPSQHRVPTPPPIPQTVAPDGEDTNPRIDYNGNTAPAKIQDVNDARDAFFSKLEKQTKLVPIIPLKYFVVAAGAISLLSLGLGIHSCSLQGENKALKQKVEQQEKRLEQLEAQHKESNGKKPKTTSFVPRCLRAPPTKPPQKVLPQRKLHRRRA